MYDCVVVGGGWWETGGEKLVVQVTRPKALYIYQQRV